MIRSAKERLTDHVDGASIAVVRIGVGLVAAISVLRLWLNGWLESLIIAPPNHLAYPGLEWVPVPPPDVMRLLAFAAFVSALCLAVGLYTRLSGAILLGSFGWLETVEATTYLNHYWLMASLVLLLTILPSGAACSFDARRHTSATVPRYAVWALRTQVVVVYFFAGVAKLHEDWLVDGLPLAIWLPSRSDLPLIGPILELPATALLASWAGAAFDLSVGFLLLLAVTRRYAYVALLMFHVATVVLLPSIGLFPVIMTIAATVFFAPDWPRRLLERFRRKSVSRAVPQPAGRTPGWAAMTLAGAWIVLQVLLPLRHLASPGDARWTGSGYRLAWNVVAVEKHASVAFWVESTDGRFLADPRQWFTPHQLRVAASEPDLVMQMAQIVGSSYGGVDETSVYADVWVSFNGRRSQALIDPTVDLYSELAPSPSQITLAPPDSLRW